MEEKEMKKAEELLKKLKENIRLAEPISLTEMAKGFGKQPIDWLKLDSTKALLKNLKDLRGGEGLTTDLIVTRKGGEPGYAGTWCTDNRIALCFGRWLSADFEVLLLDDLFKMKGVDDAVSVLWAAIVEAENNKVSLQEKA